MADNIKLTYKNLTQDFVGALSAICSQPWRQARENEDLLDLLKVVKPAAERRAEMLQKGRETYKLNEDMTDAEVTASEVGMKQYSEDLNAMEIEIPFSNPIVLRTGDGITVTPIQAVMCSAVIEVDWIDAAPHKRPR